MASRILTLNVLNFTPIERRVTFQFSTEKKEQYVRVSERCVNALLKRLNWPEDTAELYVNFDSCSGGTPLSGALMKESDGDEKELWPESVAKSYYISLLLAHFRAQQLPCHIGFAKEVIVYLPTASDLPDCKGYREFKLRVQFEEKSSTPQLLVASGTVHSLYSHPMSEPAMQDLAAGRANKYLFRNEIMKEGKIKEEALRHADELFPFLSNSLKRELSIPIIYKKTPNRYLSFLQEINEFKDKYLLQAPLTDHLHYETREWQKMQSNRLCDSEELLDELVFGGGNRHNDPYQGMKLHGPHQLSTDNKIKFFFVGHISTTPFAKSVYSYMMGLEKGFVGLQKFVCIPFSTQKDLSLFYQNEADPLPELKAYLASQQFESDTRYVAIYLSPVHKQEEDEERRRIYYRVKEELLHHEIVSQVLDVEKAWGERKQVIDHQAKLNANFNFNLPNICIALLAKLGGVPWGLKSKELNELVIGVGAFRCRSQEKAFLGSAFCFSGSGKFYGFDYFQNDEIPEMVGSMMDAVRRYREEHQEVKRLVIHFYKNMSQKELAPIERGLSSMKLDVPVYVVTVNQTPAADYFAFDQGHPQLMPFTGTYLSLPRSQYLLFNNTQTSYQTTKCSSYPFPLKVGIRYYPSANGDESTTVQATESELLRQLILFSRLYYKSVVKQPQPVTILYSELLAEIASNFYHPELPKTGKETLWFL